MPTVYTFGDSFTEDFEIFGTEEFKGSWRYDYIHDFLGGKIPKSFGKIIAEKLGYDYKCRAGIYGYPNEGNCNQSMYNNFSLASKELSEDDIVFFGYTHPIRFKWYTPTRKTLQTVLPNNLVDNVVDEEIIAMEQTLVIREKKPFSEEYIKFETLVKEFAKSRKFKVFFWSHNDIIYQHLENYIKNEPLWLLGNEIIKMDYSTSKLLYKNNGYSIQVETNGLNQDSHYGGTGHAALADLFLKEIFQNNLI